MHVDCFIYYRWITFLIGTCCNHKFIVFVWRHKFTDNSTGFLCLLSCNTAGKTAYTLENINCRIMIALCKLSTKDNMAVQCTANFICDRFIHIIWVNKNIIESCNSSFIVCSGPFQQFWNHIKYAWWITFLCRRFSFCKTNFALGMSKTGNVIKHKHNVFSLISKIFCNSSGNIRSTKSTDWRLVTCGNNYNTSFQAFFTKISINKVQYFATTFSNQSNYVYISICISGNHT